MSDPLTIPHKLIAIDFETATEARASACAVGLAFVENGRVVRVEERLIRPPGNRFAPFNTALHGIGPQDVAHCPSYPQVMAEFAQDFQGAILVAHNAAFDFSVIRASHEYYGLDYPELRYLCSVKLAQRHWPDLSSHKLNVIADYLGLSFLHHNAAEDARICAQACLAMIAQSGADNALALAESLGLQPGRIHARGYDACSFSRKQRRSPVLQG